MAQQNRNPKCERCKDQNQKWVISFCLEGDGKNLVESFTWRHEEKRIDSIF